jgi:hypothetical protein
MRCIKQEQNETKTINAACVIALMLFVIGTSCTKQGPAGPTGNANVIVWA